MLKTFSALFLIVTVVGVGCGTNSIFIGDTELSEPDLHRLLAQLPNTVNLVSGHESSFCIKESPQEYSKLVVVTPGRIGITGRIHENTKPIILDATDKRSFAPGEEKEAGTDYFVYVAPSPVGKNFAAVVSKYHPDWIGYFSPGAGKQPREYSPRTWKLLGYFHVGPQGGILRNSVTTNSNLSNAEAGVPLPGMVKVGSFAIDIYENSELNGHCISACGRIPITNITCDEAQLMARQDGKSLPTSKQWFAACEPSTFPQVLSSKPQEGEGPQNTWSGQVALTGYFASINKGDISTYGCVGMVGNVWEWCDEVIDFSDVEKMPAKKAGYTTASTTFLDIPHWPAVTSTKRAVEALGYFFFDPSLKQAGVARGGSCDDGDRAGTASLLLEIARHESSSKVGFRCVR